MPGQHKQIAPRMDDGFRVDGRVGDFPRRDAIVEVPIEVSLGADTHAFESILDPAGARRPPSELQYFAG